MKKVIVIVTLFLCLAVAKGFAETSIKAQVNPVRNNSPEANAAPKARISNGINKTIITTDEMLTYRLTITSLEKQLPLAKIPNFSGFKVASSSESSNISFIKGKVRTQIVYVFILKPFQTGNFKIEPSSIKIRNQIYSTDAFEIEVRQGKFKPPKGTQPESELPRITL